MRKKYLSALLFGALLVTSAGTFTSCKDYDDDINNLQEQITANADAIKALEELVKAGKYVSGVAIEGQVITFTFSDGSTTPITIPEGEKGQTVEVKDNELYIDGDATGIKVAEAATAETGLVKAENGTWWVLGEDGEYTNTNIPVSGVTVTGSDAAGYELTIYTETGKQTVKLPTAASTISNITVLNKLTFGNTTGFVSGTTTPTANPILWGYAGTQSDAMKNWKGPKGPVSANQTLIGQIATALDALTVTPASVDLGAQKLALVDTKGNEAPVSIFAVPASDKLSTDNSRAASVNGVWHLVIQPNEFTTDGFKNAVKTNDGYILYALEVNGVVMTSYDIAIKADVNATAADAAGFVGTISASWDGVHNVVTNGASGPVTAILKPGKTTVFNFTAADCYDSYISFEGTYKAKADALGIKVEGMNVTVPSSAVEVSGLEATLNIMNVAGEVDTKTITLSTSGSSTQDNVQLETTTVKVMPTTSKFKVDLTKAIEGMTDAQIEAVNALSHIVFSQPNGQTTFLDNINVRYYNKDKKQIVDVTPGADQVAYTDLRQVSYMEVDIDWTPTAKPGDYSIIMSMFNKSATGSDFANASEVRNVVIPVAVTLPTFNEIFPRSTQWNGDTFSAKLGASLEFDYNLAFNFNANNIGADKKLGGVTVSYDNIGNVNVNPTNQTFTDNTTAVTLRNLVDNNKHALIATELATTMSIQVVAGNNNFKVETKFTTEIHSEFEQPKLVYYVNGVAQEVAKLEAGNIIKPLYLTGENDDIKQGLAIQYGRGEDKFFTGAKVDGVEIAARADAAGKVTTSMSIDGVSSASADFDSTDKVIKISNGVTKGKLNVTFTDVNGVKTTASINFE